MSTFLHNQTYLSRRAVVGGLALFFWGSKTGDGSAHATVLSSLSFVDEQVEEIKTIIAAQVGDKIIDNKYLASTIYYSDAFCNKLANPANQVDIPTKIVGRVSHLITPHVREWATSSLEAKTVVDSSRQMLLEEHLPLAHFSFGHGFNHTDAVDLFTSEGSSVYAYAAGLVMVADDSWVAHDELSSVSMKGGNCVIIFNYEKSEFYRYAHLHTVAVKPGDVVFPGQLLGTVGHTGKNASKSGHGGHLHFEINSFDKITGSNYAVSASTITRRLAALR